MKSLAKYFLIALVALFCAGRSQAQCSLIYGLSYNQYSSTQIMSPRTSTTTAVQVYTDVWTEGDAYMLVNTGGSPLGTCPPSAQQTLQNAINSATHYLRVRNSIGSVGGSQSGASLCASCWNSESYVISVPVDIGKKYIWYQGADVVCSVGGVMSFTGSSSDSFNFWDYFEVAYTKSIRVSLGTYTPGLGWVARISAYCDAAHYPPDYNPTTVFTAESLTIYFAEISVCLRPVAPGAWVCADNAGGVIPNAIDLPSPQSPGACTHNP